MNMNNENHETLPTGWIECSVGDITLPVSKIDPRDNGHRKIAYVDISSIDNDRNLIGPPKKYQLAKAPSRARQIIHAGDVLFSTVRPYLRNIAAVPESLHDEVASTGFSVLRPASGIHPRFLFYKAISADFVDSLSGKQYGVSYPAVRDDQVRDQLLLIPPSAEQNRIVAKIEELFSELDNGIANLKTARQQLDVYRQALLKQAFEGKLTARWREENADSLETAEESVRRVDDARETSYQTRVESWEASVEAWNEKGNPGSKPRKPRAPSKLAPVTDRELDQLPLIPAGWEYVRLGAFLAEIQAGKSFKCDEREPGEDEVGVAKVSAVSWGEYNEAESKTCLDPRKIDRELFIRPGDFLFSRANTIELVGACVIATSARKKVMLSDKTLRLVFHSGSQEFFLWYLRSQTGRREIMNRSTGNQESMRNIGQDRIRSIVVPICPPPEMEQIAALLSAKTSLIDATMKAIDEELARSGVLRHAILEQAFDGRLTARSPEDEPACVLLERIRAERDAQKNSKKKGKSAS